jgi:hypothetical protein
MPIAILVLALVAYALALIAFPGARPLALAAGAIVAAVIAASLLVSRPERIAIAPSELVLDQIGVERTVRGATVTGRVRNGSAFRLRDMTLAVRLHDCADPEAAPETCPVIGEGSAIARPDVPAGQIRAFTAHFGLAGVPPVLGTLRWELTVAETRATAS